MLHALILLALTGIHCVVYAKPVAPAVTTGWSYNPTDGDSCTFGDVKTVCGPGHWEKVAPTCDGSHGTNSPIPWQDPEHHPNASAMRITLLQAAGKLGAPGCAGADAFIDRGTIRIHLGKLKKPKVFTRPSWPPPVHARCRAATLDFIKYERHYDRFTPHKYAPFEYHFRTPSEHALDGKIYPMEMQVVFHGKQHHLVVAVFMETVDTLEAECAENDKIVLPQGEDQQKERLKCLRAKFLHSIMETLTPFVPSGGPVPLLNSSMFLHHKVKAHYLKDEKRIYCGVDKLLPLPNCMNGILFTQYTEEKEKEYWARQALCTVPLCPEEEITPEHPETWNALMLRDWEKLKVVQPTSSPRILDALEVPLHAEHFENFTNVNQSKFATLDPLAYFVPPFYYFYYYKGSDTEPPCYPVEWILNPEVVGIHESTLKAFKQIMANFPGNRLSTMGKNARAFQLFNKAPPFDPIADRWGGLPHHCIKNDWGVRRGECNITFLPDVEPRKFYQIGTERLGRPLKYLDSSPLWASGSYNLASSGSFGSSSQSSESDSSWSSDGSSYRASGSMGSGSSGFYMAIWKWFALLLCFVCCCCSCFWSAWKNPSLVAFHHESGHASDSE